jgi:hypothetical protein
MAASPMAAFPVIRTLATIHLYGHFGADQGTNSAAGTFAIVIEDGRQIAAGIQLAGRGYQSLGTERDAELAALAQLSGNFDRPFHISHCFLSFSYDFIKKLYEPIFAHIIVFTKGGNYKFDF